MTRIRIDRAAIAAGSLMVGTATMIAAHLASRALDEKVWTLDRMVIVAIGTALLYGALFALANRLLRRFGLRSTAAYAGIGALAALPAFTAGVGLGFFARYAEQGSVSFALLIPLLIGATTGFLYRRSAGFEAQGDDPAALEAAVKAEHDRKAVAKPIYFEGRAVRAPLGAATAAHEAPDEVHIATGTADYYDGPLQVRGSFMAALLAALVGASLHILASYFGLIVDPLPADAMPPSFRSPGQAAVMGIIGAAIPYLLFVLIASKLLARAGQTSIWVFLAIGLAVPIILGCALGVVGLGPIGLMLTAQFILPSGIAMATYRSLAGLEPLALPDDIEVSDRRTLVGADHVRRRMARVIDSSPG
jgi:hypothetical protein